MTNAASRARSDIVVLLAEAEAANRLKDSAAAEALYRAVLAESADCAPAHRGLGGICFGSSRRDEGLVHLERAVALAPTDVLSRTALANAYAALGRFAPAATEARAAIAQSPRSIELHYLLGRILRDGGRTAEARAEFAAVLALDARHAGAARQLARILEVEGNVSAAIEAWRLAIRLEPDRAGTHYRLGRLVRGRDDAAAGTAFGEALRLDPNYAEALVDLGTLHEQRGDRATAIALYRRALAAKPGLVEAGVNLSAALLAEGAHAEAKRLASAAVGARPEFPAAQMALGRAELALEAPEAALAAFEVVLKAQPANPDALLMGGVAALGAGRHDRATVLLRALVAAQPSNAEAWANLGAALSQQGAAADAEVALRRALALEPRHAGFLRNLGFLMAQTGRHAEALEVYSEAVKVAPENGDAHLDYAHQLLRLGRFDEGWQEFEWRWKASRFARRWRREVAPAWDGTAPAGKRILLQWEQGFGDVIQFARYALPLAAAGARLVAEVQPALVRLLQTMPAFESVVASDGPLPPVDVQARLMSLPMLLGAALAPLTGTVPYLAAPEADRATWRSLLADLARPLAGVVWRGHAKHPNDQRRSIGLAALAPAVDVFPGGLVSLQQGAGRAEIEASPLASRLLDPLALCRPARERFFDFADTAGLMAELDLVIAVDTAVAHLAGALGRPCFLLLPAVGDFRWLEDRTDCPWYPTMRLFRQPSDGDWATPLGELAVALARFDGLAAKGAR